MRCAAQPPSAVVLFLRASTQGLGCGMRVIEATGGNSSIEKGGCAVPLSCLEAPQNTGAPQNTDDLLSAASMRGKLLLLLLLLLRDRLALFSVGVSCGCVGQPHWGYTIPLVPRRAYSPLPANNRRCRCFFNPHLFFLSSGGCFQESLSAVISDLQDSCAGLLDELVAVQERASSGMYLWGRAEDAGGGLGKRGSKNCSILVFCRCACAHCAHMSGCMDVWVYVCHSCHLPFSPFCGVGVTSVYLLCLMLSCPAFAFQFYTVHLLRSICSSLTLVAACLFPLTLQPFF